MLNDSHAEMMVMVYSDLFGIQISEKLWDLKLLSWLVFVVLKKIVHLEMKIS